MSDYELTITNHPSIVDDPTQPGKKLFKDGVPVPCFPSHRCIRFNGRGVAYVSPDSGEIKVMFFGFGTKLPDSVKAECAELAAKEYCEEVKPENVITPNQPAPPEDELNG